MESVCSIESWVQRAQSALNQLVLLVSDFDKIYSCLCDLKRQAEQFRSMLVSTDSLHKQLSALIAAVKAAQYEIVRRVHIEANDIAVGDELAAEVPVVLVVLGCKIDSTQKERVGLAYEEHQKLRSSNRVVKCIVFSGGGTSGVQSEAAAMREMWMSLSANDDQTLLFCEEDSLDTVGNAVFTKLLIREHIDRTAHIRVITSKYHAPRSLAIFRRVFENAVSVLGVIDSAWKKSLLQTPGVALSESIGQTKDEFLQLAIHELKR